MQLGGWQRIGIVLSLLWIALVVTYSLYELHLGPFGNGVLTQVSGVGPASKQGGYVLQSVDTRLLWGRVVALAFGPVVAMWCVSYAGVWAIRWVAAGFGRHGAQSSGRATRVADFRCRAVFQGKTMICTKCGSNTGDHAKFCEACGTPVVARREDRPARQPLPNNAAVEAFVPSRTPHWQLVALATLGAISIVLYLQGGQIVRTYFETIIGKTILYVGLFIALKILWDSFKRGNWRHRVIGALLSLSVAVLCAYLLLSDISKTTRPPTAQGTSPQLTVHEALVRDSGHLNKQLPMQVDEYMRLDRSSVSGDTLVYHTTLLKVSSDQVSEKDLYDVFYKLQLARICKAPNLKALKGMGVTMKYVYYGSDGVKIGILSINPTACK